MNTSKIFCLLFLVMPTLLTAQQKNNKDPYQEKYEWRLRQEVLYGTYIPKDVNDVFMELNKKIDQPSKNKFKSLPEEQATSKLFFSLGRWMTHNWGLYEGSRLSKHLQDFGIYHPDDMVRFLIIAYHRSLNQKPLQIKELLETFHKKNEAMHEQRIQDGTIIFEQKQKLDSIPPPKKNHR
jgi:hypothetical protein